MKYKKILKAKIRAPIFVAIIVAIVILSIGVVQAERSISSNVIKESSSAMKESSNIKSADNIIVTGEFVTNGLGSGLTQTNLVNNLLGGGVTVSNVQFKGVNSSTGMFSGGKEIIGFDSGIILSTGNISNIKGPNVEDSITKSNSLQGDVDLDTLIPGYKTNDATVLEFDFVPVTNQIQFKYVFSSDEYNEYVNSAYNDVFGFFVNKKNIALIPGSTIPVSINNVNCGNPYDGKNGCINGNNSGYYISNDLSDGGWSKNTEMDGFTAVLTATASVNAGVTNHIKLAIADAGDFALDSNVLIEAGSFKSPQLGLEPKTAISSVGQLHKLTATLVDGDGKPVVGQIITFKITNGPHNGTYGTNTSNTDGIATWSYMGNTTGIDTIVATGYGQNSIDVYKTWETAPSGDILAYYRGLNQYVNIVETNDLMKGADDWRNDIVPPGFSVSLTTNQLLMLADEWRNS